MTKLDELLATMKKESDRELRELLATGISKMEVDSPNKKIDLPFSLRSEGNFCDTTLLCIACRLGDYSKVKMLLEANADPNLEEDWYRARFTVEGPVVKEMTGTSRPIDYVQDMRTANLLIKYGARVSAKELDNIKQREARAKAYKGMLEQRFGKSGK